MFPPAPDQSSGAPLPTAEALQLSGTDQELQIAEESEETREERRLASISELQLLNKDQEAVLGPIIEEAAKALHEPVALVSLILRNTQYFLASYGLTGWLKEAQGTPREWAFCHHVVARGDSFVVEDASKDPVLCESPLVTFSGVRSYAGAPLRDRDGRTLGALCVLGDKPRQFTPEEIEQLQRFAAKAAKALDESKAGSTH